MLGPHVLHSLPAADARTLTGRSFFPHLISGPFHTALVYAFVFAILACLVAAVASLLRGGKYHHARQAAMPAGGIDGLEPVEPVTVGGSPLRPRRRGDEHGAARGAPPDRRGRRARRRDSAHDPLLRGARPARRRRRPREGGPSRLQRGRRRPPDRAGPAPRPARAHAGGARAARRGGEARAALRDRWEGTESDAERLRIVEEALVHCEAPARARPGPPGAARRVRGRAREQARAPRRVAAPS